MVFFSVRAALVLLPLWFSCAFADGERAGPGDGGGGGSTLRCKADAPWVLLDRVNRDPARALAGVAPRMRSPEVKPVNLEKFEIQASEARARAAQILARWKENSPDLVKMIEQAMDRVPYFRTSSAFVSSPQFTLNDEVRKLCSSMEIRTAILYLPRFGSIISEPLWKSLDTDTQAGLLIHEALRQIQIAYQYGTKNGDLEALVAHLMDGDPSRAPWPQDSPHIQGMLRRYFQAWRAYRSRLGADAVDDPDRICGSSGGGDLARMLDACAFSLSLTANLLLNDAVEESQMRRTEKDPKILWQEIEARGLLEKSQ